MIESTPKQKYNAFKDKRLNNSEKVRPPGINLMNNSNPNANTA
jgi:hypothetical protein